MKFFVYLTHNCQARKKWKCDVTEAHKTEVILIMEEAVTAFLEKYICWISVVVWNTQLFTSKLTICICILLYHLSRINSMIFIVFADCATISPFTDNRALTYLQESFSSSVYMVLLDLTWTLAPEVDIKFRLR